MAIMTEAEKDMKRVLIFYSINNAADKLETYLQRDLITTECEIHLAKVTDMCIVWYSALDGISLRHPLASSSVQRYVILR